MQMPLLLRLTSLLLFLAGLGLLVLGIYFGIWEGIIEPRLPGHGFEPEDMVQIGFGMFALTFGSLFLWLSSITPVIFDIALNTHSLRRFESADADND